MTAMGIIKLFGIAQQALATGMEVVDVLGSTNGLLSKMMAENRDPTDAELDEAFGRVVALNKEIQDS